MKPLAGFKYVLDRLQALNHAALIGIDPEEDSAAFVGISLYAFGLDLASVQAA
jgi:hypothetical protein